MERWSASWLAGLKHPLAQGVMAGALLVPAVATAGQYWSSGFWGQSTGVGLLFWPGQAWHWTVRMPVWLAMGAMMASYVAGIAWMVRRRTLSLVALSAVAALVVANLPAVVFAAYHVPGHGPSRLADTFILSLVFSWLALRYSFFAPLVLHYVFDAMSTLSFSKVPGIPAGEVAWLGDHVTLLNSTWSILMMLWMVSIAAVALVHRYRAGHRQAVSVG